MNEANPVIYMADDDADDRYFMRQSLQHVYPSVTIVEAKDGAELLTLLGNWSQSLTAQPIQVILLDMNMPKLNGLETLMALKANPLLRHIPTVILSTDAQPVQIATAYQAGASQYLEKPTSYSGLDQIAQTIRSCFSA
ncbi:response regulator [Spirosoma foliorum]|uniref:Response regulator n=1 Tax=Spirosoma foliorum TaxID=2710596 RepID=A0A7G5H534_9BACT|nr:response regulator [Spirosoma foliorum]QMW06226.1 response regulator [Spirosoma foliorum]